MPASQGELDPASEGRISATAWWPSGVSRGSAGSTKALRSSNRQPGSMQTCLGPPRSPPAAPRESNFEAGCDDSCNPRPGRRGSPYRGCQEAGSPGGAVGRQVAGECLTSSRCAPSADAGLPPGGTKRSNALPATTTAPGPRRARERARAPPMGSGRFGALCAEEKVADDDHSPADGDRQTGDLDVLGHVRSIVAVSQAAGR